MVVYGDEAIVARGKDQVPFAVCPPCFKESEYVEGQEWEYDDVGNRTGLRTFEIHRYVKVGT
jgi:hypothetical protein